MRKKIFVTVVCATLLGVGILLYMQSNAENRSILETHRCDFTDGIGPEVGGQFAEGVELKKVYLLLTNAWHLAEDLSDFSQVVTTDIVYVAQDVENGYSFYQTNEVGKLEWNSSAYPPTDVVKPFGFYGLTDAIIEDAVSDIRYEDYILTYSQKLRTVFVWVRGEEDKLVTYPTRPDLLGLEVGGVYTLEAVKEVLVGTDSGRH